MVQRSATPVIAVPLAHYKTIAQQSVAPHFDCAQAEGSPPVNSLVTQKAESEGGDIGQRRQSTVWS